VHGVELGEQRANLSLLFDD